MKLMNDYVSAKDSKDKVKKLNSTTVSLSDFYK